MPIRIDAQMLHDVGIKDLDEDEQRELLQILYNELEMRVGVRLADQMTNSQLDEFESLFQAKDDTGAFRWLESNFPSYKEIVNEEFEGMKAELATLRTEVIAWNFLKRSAGGASRPRR